MFIGIDGEGINEKYCLIQDSAGGKLLALEGLSTVRVFDWFLVRALVLADSKPVFVGYVTTYDVNMILRDVDDETLEKIFATDDKDFVRWNEYDILYIPRKVFKLRKYTTNGIFSFTLYDVFTFFGTSFVNACRGFLGSVPGAIEAGKRKRSHFRSRDLRTIERYNQLEVEYLVKLCEQLEKIFESQDIHLKKWHGPGAVAEYVLGSKKIDIHKDYPVYRQGHAPFGLWEAWDCAYYGGRFENMGIGTFNDVYTYDINSAYPFALSKLRILSYASEWNHVNNPKSVHEYGEQAVFLVEWNLPNGVPFGPLPWRDSQGRIFFPLNGLGWYWFPEVAAARKMFGNAIKLREVWYQNVGSFSRFASEVPRLFNLRAKLKREKNPGEYAIKIALNSIYGKLAQRVGNSPFRCIPWAGWITAYSRAMLLRASLGRESSILAYATDSVFSRERLPLLCNNLLGGWKAEHADKLLILMNGFYCLDDKTRKRKSATRGLPAVKEEKQAEEDITWNDILDGLNSKQEFTYEFTQFVTHSMAIHFPNKFGNDRLKFIHTEKTLRPFEGTRRIFETHKLKSWERQNAMSSPISFPSNKLSAPSSPEVRLMIEEEEDA